MLISVGVTFTLMKAAVALFIALAATTPSVAACRLQYDPVAVVQFYRQEGWELPGLANVNLKAHTSTYDLPPLLDVLRNVPNSKASLLPLDDKHRIIRMPKQVFELNGIHQTMRPFVAKATIVRVEVNGKIVAYSYGLIPINDGVESGCIFFANFIDDKGDGVFRLLVPDALTKDLIPAWASASPAL